MRVTQFGSLSLLVLIVAVSVGCQAMGLKKADYNPTINAADFQAKVDNPYYPLVPGTVLKYSEKSEGETLENIITVTNDTKMIMGVIIATGETVTTPAGTFKDCVKTKEWSLLEQGHENKWYAPGVGCIKEISTGGDTSELISITKP